MAVADGYDYRTWIGNRGMVMIEQTNEDGFQVAKAPWQVPTAEVLPVSQTANGANLGNDGPTSTTGS
jgi:hypothetical protein